MSRTANESEENIIKPVEIVLEKLESMMASTLEHLPQIVLSLLLLMITWVVAKLVARFIGKLFSRTGQRRSLTVFFQKVSTIMVWLVGSIFAAVIVFPSITPGKMLTALGLGSVAIGFAFKDIFENFIAGMLILLREPFQLDDYIECDGIEGKVEEITIRDTRIRQTDGQPVVLPNAMLFAKPVTVRTDRDMRRASIECGIAYSESISEAREIIEKAVAAADTVKTDQPIQVFAKRFGSSSIDFDVVWWTGSTPLAVRASVNQVVSKIKSALDKKGIEIPFPYRTLTFNEPLQMCGSGQQPQSTAE